MQSNTWESAHNHQGKYVFSFVDYKNAEDYISGIHDALITFAQTSAATAAAPPAAPAPAPSSTLGVPLDRCKRRVSLSESRLATVGAVSPDTAALDKEREEASLIQLAELLYTPVAVHVNLVEDDKADQGLELTSASFDVNETVNTKKTTTKPLPQGTVIEEEHTALDMWSSVFIATLTKAYPTLLLILQFHVTHAPQLLRYLVRQRCRDLENEKHKLTSAESGAIPETSLRDYFVGKGDDMLPLTSPFRLFTYIGETARTLFVDRSMCSSRITLPTSVPSVAGMEDAASEVDTDSFNVATIGRFALPFLQDLRVEATVQRPLRSPMAAAAALAATNANCAATAAVAMKNTVDVARALVCSINERDGAAECLSPVNEDDPLHVSPLRRAQLYVEFDCLFDDICQKGNLDVLTNLQRYVPIAPLLFVAFSDVGLRSAVRVQVAVKTPFSLRLGSHAILLPIAPQEGEKLHFLDQAIPELPTVTASLRRASSMYKTMYITGTDEGVAPSNSFYGGSPLHVPQIPASHRLSYLHVALVRLLLSRTVSPTSFEECYAQILKDLNEIAPPIGMSRSGFSIPANASMSLPSAVDFPITLPALFAACAAFRCDTEALSSGDHVIGKLRIVLNHSTLRQYLLSPPTTDGERFQQLWAPETFHNTVFKKFLTRVDLVVHAANHYGGCQTARVHFGFPTAGSSGAGYSCEKNVLPWLRSIWCPFLASLSQEAAILTSKSSTSASGYFAPIDEPNANNNNADPEIDEIAKRLVFHLADMKKAILRAERQEADNNNGDSVSREDPPASLEEQFLEAQQQFAGMANQQPNAVKLAMYSLFKQATVGDVTGSRPWAMDVTGRAKFDAWAARKGMQSETAKQGYVDQLQLLLAGRPLK